MSAPLRLGIAGIGTVGTGMLRLLARNGATIATRAGRELAVTAVSARDRARERGVSLEGLAWEDDPSALARRADVDCVVELIGGADGPALALAEAALDAGKPLVTANKAMIAHHGAALAGRAEAAGVALGFEAAVAGAVPVVAGLREGAAANAVRRVSGILNGTCNFILTAMEASGADFAETLAEAQALGYAEADPAFDIGGTDAAHKLAILAAIAFGAPPDFAGVECTGIAAVRAADLEQAAALGYVVRLLGIADLTESEDGSRALLQRVRPCLVPRGHPLAAVTGATNAVVIEGDAAGRLSFQGAGAGAEETASAVLADVVAIAAGRAATPFGVPVDALRPLPRAPLGERTGRSYIRLAVADRTGVLAEIAAAMRDGGVSIQSLIQPALAADGGEALIALVAHEGPEAAVAHALALLEGSDSLTRPPVFMPILSD